MTQVAESAEVRTSRSQKLKQHQVWLGILLVAAALRIVLWAQARSLWIDEARLSLNVATRSYLELLKPLDYDQAAPVLYLWLQRTATIIGGVNELSLRFVSLIAGITTVWLVWDLAERLFCRRVAVLACAMAALSPTLIYFSAEAKQYALEACVSCALVGLGRRFLDAPRARSWTALVGVGVVGVWVATPVPFILAGIGLAVLATPKLQLPKRLRLLAIMGVCWGVSFALAYIVIYGAASHSPYLHHYWSQAFLGIGRPGGPLNAGVAATSLLLGAAVRDRMIGTADLANVAFVPAVAILVALLAVIGMKRASKSLGLSWVALIASPLGLAVVAALFDLYPISVRTTTFYLPLLIILASAGIDGMAQRLRRPLLASVVMAASCVPLAWISLREVMDSDPREHIRPLVEQLTDNRRPAEPVYVFAGAIPAWALYTTNWRAPDLTRLEYLKRIARAGGPAFENAPGRGRTVLREGDELRYTSPEGLEIYGISDGLEARVFGLTNALPDSGWAENEARRIREAASSRVWLVLSHFYGPEGQLLDALEASGGQRTFEDLRNGSALLRYEFTRSKGPAGH
jgi:4-amino-4-deoxy-L-arabinose transferase-like glycosyltransferase